MDTLLNTAAGIAINPRVVHSLPGRMRLHIPALRRVPETWRVKKSILSEALESTPAIFDVSWSYLTGNVLIRYDREAVTESDIIEGIRKLGKFLIAKRGQLEGASVDDLSREICTLSLQFIEENVQEVPSGNASCKSR
jgi:hypothetical protein